MVSTAMPAAAQLRWMCIKGFNHALDSKARRSAGALTGMLDRTDQDLADQDLVGSTGLVVGSLTGTGVTGSETGTLLM